MLSNLISSRSVSVAHALGFALEAGALIIEDKTRGTIQVNRDGIVVMKAVLTDTGEIKVDSEWEREIKGEARKSGPSSECHPLN